MLDERRRRRLVDDGRRGSRFLEDVNATLKGKLKEGLQRTPAAIALADAAGVAEEDSVKTPTPVTTSIANKARFAVEGLPNLIPTMNRSDTGETVTPTTANTILTPTTPTRGTLAAHTFGSFGSATPTTSAFPPVVALGDEAEDTEEDEEDADEDEFFDAIDSNNIPNLVIPEHLGMVGGSDRASTATTSTHALSSAPSLASLKHSSPSSASSSTSHNTNSNSSPYTPYLSPRTSLTLSAN